MDRHKKYPTPFPLHLFQWSKFSRVNDELPPILSVSKGHWQKISRVVFSLFFIFFFICLIFHLYNFFLFCHFYLSNFFKSHFSLLILSHFSFVFCLFHIFSFLPVSFFLISLIFSFHCSSFLIFSLSLFSCFIFSHFSLLPSHF